MQETRIKINNVLKNQLPNFVKEDYPLVEELFSEYYKGQEYQGGVLDILQNIDEYVKLNNLTNLVNSTKLTSNVSQFETTIPVQSTIGFPDRYGLIQIDSEVILYKSKTYNSFVDCVRGFSGITSYENSLQFDDTIASDHKNGTSIKNLNILFLNEFLIKIKKQFAPGFENRKFFSDNTTKLNENIFIKQLKDFYSSKGTDISFKILFKALFNDDVEVIKPRDFLIRPSDAQYRVNKELVIEAIEGNPIDLIDTTIFQNPLTIDGKQFISYAYGTVNKVETISRKDKTYYIVALDFDYNKDINLRGSVYGEFVIGPKTIVTDTVESQTTAVTVDSTYGFPEKNGLIRTKFSDGTQISFTYQRKNLNQFLGCVGIDREILQGQEIYLDYYCEGGNTVDGVENPIKFRVTGVLSEALTTSDSHYIVQGNRINLRTLGKDLEGASFNNWKFNIAPSYKIKSIERDNVSNSIYKITLYDEHNFYDGDSAKIISSRPQLIPGTLNSGFSEFSANRVSIISKYAFNCSVDFDLDLESDIEYQIERKINKFNYVYNNNFLDNNNVYITDVQNIYKDSEGFLYISSQSLPTYANETLSITDETVSLNTDSDNFLISTEVNESDQNITDKILNIKGTYYYKTGDSVYYQPGNGENKLNLPRGIYYVKFVRFERRGSNNYTLIKLSSSRTNIDNNIFLDVSYRFQLSGTDNKLHKTTNEIVYFQNNTKNLSSNIKYTRNISPKNLIRKITSPVEIKNKKLTEPGQIGILVNGVEIVNYKSNDFIYYGAIEDIKIKSAGNDYDVINPPRIQILDKNGTGAAAICHVSGQLSRVDILDGGFDYENTPLIEISGGNGVGAEVSANLSTFDYSLSFKAEVGTQVSVDGSTVNPNTIIFNKKHKFYEGEQVKYDYTQVPIVGLDRDVVYYVSYLSDYLIGLHNNYSDSIKKINYVKLLDYADGDHFLISVNKKKTIQSVNIVNPGSGYSNRKVIAQSQDINVYSDKIKIPNHGFNTGETIVYSTTGSSIVGLSTTLQYIVYKVDDNQFKLCGINTLSEDKNFYLKTNQFVNITGIGTGNHIFNYPPIKFKITGTFKNKKLNESELGANIVPAFRGKITSVFIENGGVGYGSSDIINYNRQPDFNIGNGKGAELRPIISNGKISEVLIVNGGSGYTAIPEIQVSGSGSGAKLLPIILNQKIEEIKIVSGGINYNPNDTFLNVISAGSGANFEFTIQNWNINSVERNIKDKNILSNDIILNDTKNEYGERISQVTHNYAPRKLRESLIVSRQDGGRIIYKKDLFKENGTDVEKATSDTHSPIIGWAYDGNPIYGPFGFENIDGSGTIKRMKSGYGLNTNKANRPDLNIFPAKFFVEDYDYLGNGDLDEYNGRFCATPEFPNGVYAYFATFEDIDSEFDLKYLRPSFPYLIGNYYKSQPIDFNYDFDNSQNSIVFEKLNMIRNTSPYKFISDTSTYNYVFNPIDYEEPFNKISRVDTGKIDSITIVSGGENYKVGDKITLSEDEFGLKSYAEVVEVKGQTVSSISVNYKEIPNVEFGLSRSLTTVVGVASTPHSLKDQDVINIVGLNEIFTNKQKNVSSRINVFTNEIFLTKEKVVSPSDSIVTFDVAGNLSEYAIKPNDIYYIEQETVKILNIDREKSTIRVKRDSVGVSTYRVGTKLLENPRRFEVTNLQFSVDENYPLNNEIYFNPLNSVGFGTVGLTTSVFSEVVQLNYQVLIDTNARVADPSTPSGISSPKTGLIFNNPQNANQFKIGDYISLTGSTNPDFNLIQKVKVLNVDAGSIIVDYDSSSLSGIGVISFVTKWKIKNIPIRSIYLPNHSLNTGDKIRYFSNTGAAIGVSSDKVNTQQLINGELLYAYVFDSDYIGISKSIVGLNTQGEYLNPNTGDSLLYFKTPGSLTYHSFKTEYDVQVGSIVKNIARVSTNKNSSLFFNEKVNVSVKSNLSRTITVKYNKENRRLVVNPKSFIILDVNTEKNSITINDHQYSTGDKVILTTPSPTSELQNNKIYYIVVVDSNTIQLSDSYYNATLSKPVILDLDIFSATFGEFSLVNPAIKLYRNEVVRFDLTDKSLSFVNNERLYSAFKFKIYKDKDFIDEFIKSEEDLYFSVKRYGEIGITNNASVELTISDKTPQKLFYRLELDNISLNIPENQLEYIIDDNNIDNNNTLFVLDSVYSGKYNVYNVTNNYFEYLLDIKPERNSYLPANSELFYTTNSYSTLGEMYDVQVLSKDRKYRVLPGITSISSKTGTGAILFPYSENIGSVKKVKIQNIGFDYSSDYSLRPTGNLPQIVSVEPLSIFKDIKVTSIGKNYTIIPDLIVIDGLSKIQDKQAELKFIPDESRVEIIQNSSGLFNKTPYIIPINNSNGITAKEAIFDKDTKILKLIINALFLDTGELPFVENERILLENFRVNPVFVDENGAIDETITVKGINSENYGYALFEILDVSSGPFSPGVIQVSSIDIDLSSYLQQNEQPGDYQPFNSFGYIVPEKYFPKFEITLQKNNFIIGEEVITSSGYNGIVEYWDRENETVSILADKKFIRGDRITGKTSNLSGVVGKVEFFDAEYSTNSFSVVQKGWDTKIGFLNDNTQRIHDNDYYQYFSYALKSKIQISEWMDPVSSLNHTAGFKKFGTLDIESSTLQPGITTVSYSELNSVSDFFEVIDLNSYHDFDLVTENDYILGNRIVSDQIIFDTREIQDYSESIGNRVLMIDDFSNEFNNLPRVERFSIVDTFPIYQSRHRKYFVYVKDKLFFNERQFSIVSMIHDNSSGFVNQYGRLETFNELGTFDFVVNGDEGQLQFKPYDYEFNDFDVDIVSYSLFDTFIGLGTTTTTTFSIGNIARFSNEVSVLPANSTVPINISKSSSIEYRSIKLLLTINSQDSSYRESSELNIVHNGTDVYITEYGKLFTKKINPPVGLSTYNAYINGENLFVDLVPYVGYGSTVEVNVLKLEIGNSAKFITESYPQSNTTLESGFLDIPSNLTPGAVPTPVLLHEHSILYGGGYYYISIQDVSESINFQSLELLTLNDQLNVYSTQFGSISTNDSFSLGSFSTQIVGNKVKLFFTPIAANKNISIRFYYNGIKTITEPDVPANEVVVDLKDAQISSFNSDYIGTENAIKRSFQLYHKKLPIFKRTFRANGPSFIDLTNDFIKIPNHYFTTGEEVVYDSGGDDPIGIATTTISGIGLTDKLPEKLYIVKVNDVNIRVAASASEALKPTPKYLNLNSYGTGSQHTLTGKRGNSRSLITIDNMIQSPIVSTSTTTSLAANIALKDIRVKVEDPSVFIGGDVFKVNDEIIRVKIVGFGSTNTLLVNRYWLGTLPGIHSTGDVCTKIKGNYNIVKNTIHFYDPPYGKVPIAPENPRYDETDFVGITTYSSFSGRIFNKSGSFNTDIPTYSDNILLDDISEQFTGIATVFDLTENQVPVTGISTSNLFVLIKDILQIPNNEARDNNGAFELGQNITGQTTIVFNDENQVTNLDDINSTNIPSGGIIVSVGSTFGNGYQPLKSASGNSQIDNNGQFVGVSIGFTGSGYRVSGGKQILVSAASTISAGSNIIPINEEKGLFDKMQYSSQIICNVGIGTTLHDASVISYDAVASTITLSKSSDVIIPKGTAISINLQSLTAEIVDIGIRTESDSNYQIYYVGFTTVINGSISTDLNLINPGVAFTNFYDKLSTRTSISVSSGSTIFYLNTVDQIFEGDFISINSSEPLEVVSVGNTFVQTLLPYTTSVPFNQEVLVKRYTPPQVIFDSPVGYSNIPLIYSSSSGSSGIGTGAKIKINVGEDGSVIDYDIQNNGFGYKKLDVLTVPTGGLEGIPLNSDATFDEFKIFVDEIYNTKFASWSIGDLLVIDNFDDLFNGTRQIFPIKINKEARSIRAKKGSTLDIQATLIVLFNDILQVPGQGYIFKGGSIIYFPEPPKPGDRVSIIFYRGNEEVDVVDVDILETVKIGDGLKIVSDKKSLNQFERIVTDVVSSDYANTNPYSDKGISQDFNLLRPVILSKQNFDLVIDGQNIGKDRKYYESNIYPMARLIQDIGLASTEIYVDSLKTFFDNDAESIIDKDRFIIKIINQSPLRGATATSEVSSNGLITLIDVTNGGYGYEESPKVIVQNSPLSVGAAYSMQMELTDVKNSVGLSTSGISSAILGEQIVGSQSGSIGLLLTKISDYDISYVPLNSLQFIQDEEIRFEKSDLSAKIVTLSDTNTAKATCNITNGVVTSIDIINPGYGYTYGPINNLVVKNNGSGYPETLNLTNNVFYNARLKSVTGKGVDATVNITLTTNPINPLEKIVNFEITHPGSSYSVGDILKVETFDNINIGFENRSKILDTPIIFEVSSIKSPIVIIDAPTPEVEVIKEVKFEGDFGIIANVSLDIIGSSTNVMIFDLYIPEDSYLRNVNIIGDSVVGSAITISQLKENDYFVITNSNIGDGVKTLRSDGSVIGIASVYIDNVYQVYSSNISQKTIPGLGNVYVNTVTSIVESHPSLTMGTPSYGDFSWGKIKNLFTRTQPKEFETYQDVISGIGSNPIIQRLNPLKYEQYPINWI